MSLPFHKGMEGFRYEKKFVIRDLGYHEIERALWTSDLLPSEIYQGRRVNSIYFDTPTYRSYEDHLAGVSKRLKIRVRWYGDTFGEAANPKLELKIRQQEQCGKETFKLESFHVGKHISKRTMADIFRSANLPVWVCEMLHDVEPVIIVSYHRRYFMSKPWNCRITLDDNLRFYDLQGKMPLTVPLGDDLLYILELKCPIEEYDNLCSHLGCLPFHMSAYSKYVAGLQGVLEH